MAHMLSDRLGIDGPDLFSHDANPRWAIRLKDEAIGVKANVWRRLADKLDIRFQAAVTEDRSNQTYPGAEMPARLWAFAMLA